MSHAVRARVAAPATPGAESRPAELEYEGLVTRAIAFTIDAAIINCVAVVTAAVVALVFSVFPLPSELDPVLAVCATVTYALWLVGYFVTLWSSTGQTMGNRLMHIRVLVEETGRPPRPLRSLLRLGAMFLAAIPLLAGYFHHPHGLPPAQHSGYGHRHGGMRGRRVAVGALLVVATLMWTASALGVWANRQAVNTDNWVDTSSELLESEPIRTAVGVYLVDKLFASSDVQARIEEALPPALDRLAAPAAAGLQEVARRRAPELLGNALAVRAWREANRVAHQEFIDVLEGKLEDRGVNLNLEELVAQLAARAGLPAEVAERLPPGIAQLEIAKPDELETVQSLFDLFKTLVWVFIVLAVAAFAGAVALSPDRRRTMVTVGFCLMFTTLLIFAIRKLGERYVLDALAEAPNAQAAAADAWQISTSLLRDVGQGSFLFGLFIVLGAWLAGAGRRATAARRFSAFALRERAGWVFGGLAVLLLLLVIWGPVPWTQNILTVLIFTVIAFAWLEWIRRRVVQEFPSEPAPRLSLRRERPA